MTTLPYAEQCAILAQCEAMLADGHGWRALQSIGGFGWAALRNHVTASRANGGRPPLKNTQPTAAGRPTKFVFSDADAAIAKWHRLTKTSLAIAIECTIADQRVTQELRQALQDHIAHAHANNRRPTWPDSVRRAYHITDEEHANFRGGKTASHSGMITRRGLTWIDGLGDTHQIRPGELWELDDYSTNQPYTWTDPETGEQHLGRQVLAARDLASGAWLGFDHIGRERDAYRGEDIVRFIARLMHTHGVPRFMRLERGSWESSYVHGLTVEGICEQWGALDELTLIQHTWTSKGKGGIEGAFDHLQNWLGHTATDIGRHRGEYAEAQKRWAKGKKSHIDPRQLGFHSLESSADTHETAARLINTRPQQRRALKEYIAPDDLIAREGWHTTQLRADHHWHLLPYRAKRTVQSGNVTVNPGNGWQQQTYQINGVNEVHLENGHQILIAYDPADPERGAYIANADTSAKNRHSYRLTQPLITHAPLAQDAPQIDLTGRRHSTIDQRRKASANALTSYRAIRDSGQKASPKPARDPAREAAILTGKRPSTKAGNLPNNNQTNQLNNPAPQQPQTGTTTSRGGKTEAQRRAHLARLQAEAEADIYADL